VQSFPLYHVPGNLVSGSHHEAYGYAPAEVERYPSVSGLSVLLPRLRFASFLFPPPHDQRALRQHTTAAISPPTKGIDDVVHSSLTSHNLAYYGTIGSVKARDHISTKPHCQKIALTRPYVFGRLPIMHQTNDIKTIDSTRLRYLIIPCISFIFFLIISVSSLNAQGVSRHQGAGLSCASCHQEAPPPCGAIGSLPHLPW